MTSNKEGTDIANRTILHDWLGILYSCVYLWVTVMYMVRLAPPGSQVLCKSGQIVLLPLFKPSALSLWPALMPMVQMVYWLSVSVRAAIMGPYAYVGIISPGKRPFELNVLTLIHAWLLSVPLLVYILATIFFAPLVLLFGIFLYRKSDAFFVSCLCCLQLLSFLVLDLTSFVLFFVALLLASFSSLSFPFLSFLFFFSSCCSLFKFFFLHSRHHCHWLCIHVHSHAARVWTLLVLLLLLPVLVLVPTLPLRQALERGGAEMGESA